MALKRGISSHKSRGGRSRLPIVLVIFFSVLSPFYFFFGRGLFQTTANDQTSTPIGSGNGMQGLDWREQLALQHVKSLFSKEVMVVVTESTADLGPLSLDSFRKSNLSASWTVIGEQNLAENNSSVEVGFGVRGLSGLSSRMTTIAGAVLHQWSEPGFVSRGPGGG